MDNIKNNKGEFYRDMICILLAMFLELRIVLIRKDEKAKARIYTPSGYYADLYIDLNIVATT